MKFSIKSSTILAAAIMATFTFQAYALPVAPSIVISEVDANGSAATYAADWFELTNTGSTVVDITGWKMDDNSNAFASSVALRGVTSIAAGQSVIFLEGNATGTSDATIISNFKSAWFGNNLPAGLTIGNYGGSGVGLSATADAVNIFNSTGSLITRVDFGASTIVAGMPTATFDNAAGLNNMTLTKKSLIGINGAFASLTTSEIGSIAAVPEADTYAMMLAGLGLMGYTARRCKSRTTS
jgi:hypothetical protein